MATSFPSNPVVGQTASLAGSEFVWNGSTWLRITSTVSLNAVNMDALLDVNVSSPAPTTGQVLAWSGTEWKPQNQVATQAVPAATSKLAVISQFGSDSTGDGSMGNPYATLAHAVGVISHSGTIFVMPGTYNIGTYNINKIGVSVIGLGDKSDILFTCHITETSGFGGWVFENITFTPSETDGAFKTTHDSTTNNRSFTFRKCYFAGLASGRGVFLKGSHGALFEQCEFFSRADVVFGNTNRATWIFKDSPVLNFQTSVTNGAGAHIVIDGAYGLNVYDHTNGNLQIMNVPYINQFASGSYFGSGQGSLIIENSSFINRIDDTNGLLSKSGAQPYEFYNVILPTTIAALAGTNTSRTVENTLLLAQLSDVSNTAPTVGQSLKWNGSQWAPSA